MPSNEVKPVKKKIEVNDADYQIKSDTNGTEEFKKIKFEHGDGFKM